MYRFRKPEYRQRYRGFESPPLRLVQSPRCKFFYFKNLQRGVLIGTVDCAETVPIRDAGGSVDDHSGVSWFIGVGRVVSLFKRALLEIAPEPRRRRALLLSVKFHVLHLAAGLVVVQVVIPMDHLAVAMPQPAHQHPLLDADIRAVRTEVVPE